MLPEPLNTIKQKPLQSLYIGGALLLVLGGWLWWAKVGTNPRRVFWETVSQSLSTSAVTIQATQTNGAASLKQTVQYSLGPNSASHTVTVLKQSGTTVVDELVGTPTADYTRYLNVQTDQKTKSGKPLNFQGIIGQWAKNDAATAKPQLLGQSVLGTGLPIGGVALPIGNLPAANRAKLIKEIKDDVVYQVDYASAKKQTVAGRGQYVYDVTVQPVSYAALMQRFAQLTGLHELDGLDPASFKGQPALKMQLTVDIRAHHVVAAVASTNGAKQTYTSYDVPVAIAVPKQAISVQELQSRLSRLQQ
ncbi:MAG TPA: hypothetical protein VLF71_01395 [Candidatus Saccharimonadales bacterium]|nr:hypothetical protein [Candidatus Saccharimonadales bacterium]